MVRAILSIRQSDMKWETSLTLDRVVEAKDGWPEHAVIFTLHGRQPICLTVEEIEELIGDLRRAADLARR